MRAEAGWKLVAGAGEETYEDTHRLRVPGGWIYRYRSLSPAGVGCETTAVALVYVPDPKAWTKAIADALRERPAPQPRGEGGPR